MKPGFHSEHSTENSAPAHKKRKRESAELTGIEIPIVDLSGEHAATVKAISTACTHVGFLAVVGHSVDMDLFKKGFEAARAFFHEEESFKGQFAAQEGAYGFFPRPQVNDMIGETLKSHTITLTRTPTKAKISGPST